VEVNKKMYIYILYIVILYIYIYIEKKLLRSSWGDPEWNTPPLQILVVVANIQVEVLED